MKISRPVVILSWFLFVYCSDVITASWTKRSTETPNLQELMLNPPQSFKIGGTDCTFTKIESECPVKYKGKGTCSLHSVSQQLFPDINLEESTSRLIVPAKFNAKRIEIFACPQNEKNGVFSIAAKSTESVELAPHRLTLGAETKLTISWNTLIAFDPKNLEVKLDGFTSIGSDAQVQLKVEKSFEGSDYTLTFKTGTLNVNNFLAKFEIDASQMISSDLNFANSRMGIATLIIQEPEIGGLFSPGGGFEIVATGRIAAPELPADASKFYIIVQDFKEGMSESGSEEFAKPIAAVFALYQNERVQNLISSLTNMNIPRLLAFRDINEVAITVATEQLFNINSKTVRELANKFVPVDGRDMISKGLTVMHNTQNRNSAIKDETQKTIEKVYFRIEVTKDGLTWTFPQRIETQMDKLGTFVWSIKGCGSSLAIPSATKVVFVDMSYVKTNEQMEIKFNLTEKVPVLTNGLVSLLNSTITLFSQEKTDDCSWKLRGEGKETILDELVDITITQREHRTTVSAAAQIFDMETLMNRTKAKPFNSEYEEDFPFLTKLPLTELRYEASFEWTQLLKFKGLAMVDGKPNVEVVYSIIGGTPQLKLGLRYKKQNLYKVINMFYREDKIKSTWIKFQHLCIVVKNDVANQQSLRFDRDCLEEADNTFSTAGIGFIAENLIATDCNGDEWKMCNFLKTYIGDVLEMKYVGKMLPERMSMSTNQQLRFDLAMAVTFYSSNTKSKIESSKGGGRLTFEANLFLSRTFDMFPGKIVDDGTNKIMLKFAFDPERPSAQNGRNLLGVNYARMEPVRSTMELPATEHMKAVEFQSRLHIGSVQDKQVEFFGSRSREYLWYSDQDFDPRVRFVSERDGLKLKNIFDAFAVSDTHRLLNRAKFNHQVVIGYTSLSEEWNVPEYDLIVKKGLHFYGKLTLKTEETYDATINLLESMQLQTIIHLRPLRYGKIVENSHGKPTFQYVNLFLYKDSERPELGPDLVAEGQTQYLKGYAETVGLEGSFRSESVNIRGDNFQHQIKLRGNLYKEVENAEVTLTTVAEDKPSDFEFKYEVDLLHQGRSNVNGKLREVLGDIKNHAKKGRDAAREMANSVEELLNSYKERSQGYLNEMSSVKDQIHNINSNVDLAMIDISTDCIDQCKTVAMPGIEWQEDCLQGSGGQRNMNCMTWNADKEKVVNVICVLKCEAKKMAAAGEAASNLREIRILVNRYREQKVLHQDIGKLIELIEQGDEVAKSTKELVESKTDIQDEVNELLTLSGDIVELNILKVDTQLKTISPPCLPFHLDFTLKTTQLSNHNGIYPICFNGEFYKNVGLRMMRVKYTAIDDMYKALEEAELRYRRIDGIKKSLSRVENDIKKESKRGSIPSSHVEDPVELMLTKIAKRRIPAFTLKSDKTTLAFQHYSPWATMQRSNPFEVRPEPPYMKHNIAHLRSKSACHQTREIIAEFNDISQNLQHLSTSYKHGKSIYGQAKKSVIKDLQNSHSEISRMMNRTNLYHAEKRDMLFWYKFTKEGMANYLQTFGSRLSQQNKRSLGYLKRDLSSFYGVDDFVGHLSKLGNHAIQRSTVDGSSRHKKIMSIAGVGRELQRTLSMSLEDAEPFIAKLKDNIQSLYTSSAICS